MPRTKTAKSIASRLEIDYFKKGERLWFRRSRLIVTGLCLLIAVVFWGAYHFRGDKRGALYNPGPVARAHAAFESECWQCHDVPKGPRAVLKNGLKTIVADSVSDAACLKCHSASVHSQNQVQFVMGKDGHAAQAKTGGTFAFGAWQDPDTLDPQTTGLAATSRILIHIYDPLLWRNPADGKFYPGLATSWDISADGKEYTFHLRNDVKFHNGEAFTANAVKFGFDRIADPDVACLQEIASAFADLPGSRPQ